MTLEAPQLDLATFGEGDAFDGPAAFEASFGTDTDERKEKAASEAPSDPSEKPVEKPAEDPEGKSTEDPAEASTDPSEASEDDVEVELPHAEGPKKFKVKELLALAAERDAITSRSTALQEQAAKVQAEAARYQTGLQSMLKRAEEKWAPFANVDWLVLQTQVDPETFAATREMAKEALQEVQYFKQTLDKDVQEAQARNAQLQREAAAAAVKELTDPQKGIKGFNNALYKEIVDFAVSQGLSSFQNVTAAPAIRLMHDAMQFRKGLQAATTQVTKVVNKPTKVLRPTGGKQSSDTNDGMNKAMAKLRSERSVDAAADAFMASFRK
jgi:hypothetical protein